jgi:DNA-3-methyladenine glycosylase II
MSTPYYATVRRHLSRRDTVLKALIKTVGPCTWKPLFDEPLTLLVRCVISQQISTKAADTITTRLLAKLGGPPVRAAKLAGMSDEEFRECGVSGPKQRALRAVVEHVAADRTFLKRLPELEDDEFRAAVTRIKGIGPWSADMLLMFGLGRPDVLPVGDFGLKAGVRRFWELEELPSKEKMEELAEPWRPYRSVATWYIWRGLGGVVPHSGNGAK